MREGRATGITTATVYVTVEDGRVAEVVVDDENVPWDKTEWQSEDGRPLSKVDAEEAQAVVDADQIWPSWSFGW